MNTKIHIGDSGFREVMTDGFTVSKLSAIAIALAQLRPRQKAVIGYDNRFLSEDFAHHLTRVLLEQGWEVQVISDIFPTPGVVTLLKETQSDLALMVTASHNPYYYNGLKIFDSKGALIPKKFIQDLQELAQKKWQEGNLPEFNVGWRSIHIFSVIEARDIYFRSLFRHIDKKLIRKNSLKVVWDAFGGTDQRLFPQFLKSLRARQVGIWMESEPTYHLRRLEPDKTSLTDLSRLVRKRKALVGLATDVDGDRFSVLDEKGSYVRNNFLTSLLSWYLMEMRGESGNFYQTISCSEMSKIIASEHQSQVKIFPVGFQAMGTLMKDDPRAVLAMEETGGLAYAPHLPFKDGFMAHLLILEMLARTGKNLSRLISDLHKKYGHYYYDRIDFEIRNGQGFEKWMDPHFWEACLDSTMIHRESLDGEKWYFQEGWILVRRSKTEPLIRVYFESKSKKFIKTIKEILNEN